MTGFQKELLKKYLNSSLFPSGVNNTEATHYLASSRNSSELELQSEGKYIVSYGGILGLGSKIKDVAFFTENCFYLRRVEDKSAAVVPYDMIERVLYDRGDKYAVVQCKNSKNYVVPKFAGPAAKGIEIIMKTDDSKPHLLSEYLLSMQEKFFGEYQTVNVLGLFENHFPKQSILNFIVLRCNLVDINLNQAVFEIKIKDKDYEFFSDDEWETGIEEFSSRHDVLEKLRGELSKKLCFDYPEDGICFTSRYKKTLRCAIGNTACVVADATSTITDTAYKVGNVVKRNTLITASDAARRAGEKETAEYYRDMYRDTYLDTDEDDE